MDANVDGTWPSSIQFLADKAAELSRRATLINPLRLIPPRRTQLSTTLCNAYLEVPEGAGVALARTMVLEGLARIDSIIRSAAVLLSTQGDTQCLG